MLQLDPHAEKQISDHGREAYPLECCGFLIGQDDQANRRVLAVRRAKNTRTDAPGHRYSISPEETLATEKEAHLQGSAIVGFYHSHPDSPARPSREDQDTALPFYSYLIVSIHGGHLHRLTAWRRSEAGPDLVREALSIRTLTHSAPE